MAYDICDKLKNLTPYEPISGSYPIRLDANESFMPPDEGLRLRIIETVAGISFNRYPDALAADVCSAFAHRFGVGAEHVTAGNGSDELIALIIGSMLQKGDTLLTLAPDFSMYRFYGELQELRVVTMQKGNDLAVSAEEILAAAKKADAAAIIFSNPCNPTSLVMSVQEVLSLASQTDALVIVDEAYMDFSDQPVVCKAPQLDNVIVLKTCSKAIGAAAIRLGFAISNARITSALRAAKSPYNTDSLSQAIGTILLNEDGYLEKCVKALIRSR
ncbi:MAG: histidinol-phosphate transaminase, partial [Acetanaerobacterium sp.]